MQKHSYNKGKGINDYMCLFKRKCRHVWIAHKRSNLLQQDDMGYPLRLFIVKCDKCGKYDQMWIDVPENELKELETGDSVLVKWH